MRTIFRDFTLQKAFERIGLVKVPFLTAEKVGFFTDFYRDNPADTAGLRFHSTMFSSSPAYRKKVDETIKAQTKEIVDHYLIDFKSLFANYIIKEPGEASKVGIHQDWNFVDERQFISVNFWCPLIDITEETGLFYALKGSQDIFKAIRTSPHHNVFSGLEDIIEQHSEAYSLKAGEAILYNNALVHFSKPNLSRQIRLAVASAMIPHEAESYHYYMDTGKEDKKIEIYKADAEFFTKFEIGKKPEGEPDKVINYDDLPVTRESLIAGLNKAPIQKQVT